MGDILVALITALGTVWAAAMTLRAGVQRKSRHYSQPLMDLCAVWGRTRGVAEAAVENCGLALAERRGESSGGRVLTTAQRDRIFWAETQPSSEFNEQLRGEFSTASDGLLPEFSMYGDAVKEFRRALRELGDRIDAMSSVPRPSEIGVDRYLPRLEAELPAFDKAFERCVESYLQRKDGVLLYRVRRRLHGQAAKRYENFQHSGKSAFAYLCGTESADAAAPGEGARSDRAEPPPCGYCIWRCPHVPDLSFAATSPPGADGAAAPARGRASIGPQALGSGVTGGALPAASR